MITAREARKITEESDGSVDAFIEKEIMPEVVRACTAGLDVAFIHKGSSPLHVKAAPSVLEKRVIEKLNNQYEFTVSFGAYGAVYVPLGMASDFDSTAGPLHQSFGFKITW
jgi:hypothetical protein